MPTKPSSRPRARIASCPSDSSQSLRSSQYPGSSSTTRILCFIQVPFVEAEPWSSNRAPKPAHHYGDPIVLIELSLESNHQNRGDESRIQSGTVVPWPST